MVKSFYICTLPLLTLAFTPPSFADHKHTHTKSQHHAPAKQKISAHPLALPQIEIYEAHQGNKSNYIIALYTHQQGASLISYTSQTCQADSHGTTLPNPKNSSQFEFTAREDPFCKITLQKTKKNQLKVIKETAPCGTWHGDLCSFSSLPTLNRIYP